MRKQRKDWGTDLNKSLFPLEKKKNNQNLQIFLPFLAFGRGKIHPPAVYLLAMKGT